MTTNTLRRYLIIGATIVAALALAGYGGAIAYLKLNEVALVYPRQVSPNGYPPPADSLHLAYRTVAFTTEDSVHLAAWIVPAAGRDSGGVWVLLCHGQTGNLATTTRPQYYAWLRSLGVNILAFDWRGFGASEGQPTEEGLYRDATAGYEFLRHDLHVAPESIIIFGHSLGTAPAIELAARVSAAGLVVEGAPSSVIGRAQELYPLLPMRLIASTRFNSLERIGSVRMPILLLHARDDAKVPFAHGFALYSAAHEPRRLVSLGGAHHDAFLRDSATYFGAYAEFLRIVRGRRP